MFYYKLSAYFFNTSQPYKFFKKFGFFPWVALYVFRHYAKWQKHITNFTNPIP